MNEHLRCVTWHDCCETLKVQRRWGISCTLFLALALVGILDGLQSLRRAEANLVELVAGTSESVSGSLAIRHPLRDDFRASFAPNAPALQFDLEGFFTGYIFGSGMWRGTVRARADAKPGRYILSTTLKGLPARATQRYTVCVYANEDALRSASLSFLQRTTGHNPFLDAAFLGVLGLCTGIVVFLLGQRHIRQLAALGCAEVIMVRPDTKGLRLWCLAYSLRAPALGTWCTVLDAQGTPLGEASLVGVRKGTLEMTMASASPKVSKSCFVRLRSPIPPEKGETHV